MKFTPSGNWLVLPDPTITQTESGIFLDEQTAKDNAKNSNVLEVIKAGPNCIFVKKGNTVMVDPRSEAIKAVIDEKNYLLVGEHQILGKW